MKNVKFLSIFILFINIYSFSQENSYKNNAWSSIVWKHNFSSTKSVSSDFGYRSFDNFTKQKRQGLMRVFFENKINDKHSIGLGIAAFESVDSDLQSFRTEVRPYFQYHVILKKELAVFGIRLRDEMRYYLENMQVINRTRLQLSYEFQKNNLLCPKGSIEGFVSAQKNPLIEQRYSISNTFNSSGMISLNIFYILQLQSNVRDGDDLVKQNILGLQLLLNTQKNVE